MAQEAKPIELECIRCGRPVAVPPEELPGKGIEVLVICRFCIAIYHNEHHTKQQEKR